nr:glycoside hydrolase family 3 N-terminal domain-containing protein [Maliibacterium massiliense]
MKKRITLVLLLALALCAGCAPIRETSGVPSALTSASPFPSATAQRACVQGVVQDASMHSLTLALSSGGTRVFDTVDADMSLGDTGLMVGATVAVTYREDAPQHALAVALITAPPAPSAAQDPIAAMIEGMTLEQKVGQMFFIRCPETDAGQTIAQYHVGGVILFAENTKNATPQNLKGTIDAWQQQSGVPLLVGVDEEGGTVVRISRYPQYRASAFQSPQQLYAAGGFDAITADTAEKCQLLRSLGVNVNLAPVCDVSTNADDYINARAFGQNAQATSAYVQRVVSEMNRQNMGCTLKHFPGYGNNRDTHTGFSIDERSLEHFHASDLKPFSAGIASGAGSVLVSHNVVTCMDGENPASLSPAVHTLLRQELGFEGVIMSDDLLMDAIHKKYAVGDAAVKAVLAGNDMLISSEYDQQMPAVIAAVQDGTIAEASIDASVARVLRWKAKLGLIDAGA